MASESTVPGSSARLDPGLVMAAQPFVCRWGACFSRFSRRLGRMQHRVIGHNTDTDRRSFQATLSERFATPATWYQLKSRL